MPNVTFIYLFTIFLHISLIKCLKQKIKNFNLTSSFINPPGYSVFPCKQKPTHANVTLSGIQPSGEIHIGNYIGCIHPSLNYQKTNNDLHIMIADNHALSSLNLNDHLKRFTKSTISLILASGINPDKTKIFLQSQFPQILEINWIIGSVVRTGKFHKLAQFRNRGLKIKNENISTFMYPLLMTSDILSLNASSIIAGHDQTIHLTLARYIAKKLNRIIGSNYFSLPEMAKVVSMKVNSLADGTKKMSKSTHSKMDVINLLDSDDEIFKKLRNAKTQNSQDELTPEIKNLVRIYSFFSSKPYPELIKNIDTNNFFKLKTDLATSIIDFLRPIKRRYYEIVEDSKLIDGILTRSKEQIGERLNRRLKEIKDIFNYYNL